MDGVVDPRHDDAVCLDGIGGPVPQENGRRRGCDVAARVRGRGRVLEVARGARVGKEVGHGAIAKGVADGCDGATGARINGHVFLAHGVVDVASALHEVRVLMVGEAATDGHGWKMGDR